MYIKKQTEIPPGVKITRVPPGVAKARSLRSLARAEEKRLEQEAEAVVYQKRFKEAIKNGMSVVEAAVYATKDPA